MMNEERRERKSKAKKKKERKERKKITAKLLAYPGGRWLSNIDMQDAKKIKRTFSQVVEGPPRRTERESVEELSRTGIVGLYQKEKSDEAC